MESPKFPIRVDLSAFFTDERKQVMVMVDPGWETVGDLQRALKSRFGIPVDPAIMSSDGYFLPASESIMLASHVDKLKAFVPTLTNYGPTVSLDEMRTPLSRHTSTADLSSVKQRKKRKFSALKESNADTEDHKRSKTLECLASNHAADKQRSALSLGDVHLAMPPESSGEKSIKKQKKKHREDKQDDEEEAKPETMTKEKTKKKEKQKKARGSVGENTLGPTTVQIEKSKRGTLQNSRQSATDDNTTRSNSHVFFDDQETPLNATALAVAPNVTFVCPLDEVKMEKPRIIVVSRRKKILLEIKENILLVPPGDPTAMYTIFSKPQDAEIQNSTALHGDTSMGGDKSASGLENTSAMENTVRENDATSIGGLEDMSRLPPVEETSTVSTMVERMDTDSSLPCEVTQAEGTVADITAAEGTVAEMTEAEGTVADMTEAEGTVADITGAGGTLADITEAEEALADVTAAEGTAADELDAEEPTESVIALDECTDDENTMDESTVHKSKANSSEVKKNAGKKGVDNSVMDDSAVDDSAVDESTVISEDDDDVIELSDNDTNQEVDQKSLNISQISRDIKGMPVVGDTILFKLRTRCGQFLTKYMQAKCVYALKRSKSVKLDVTGSRGELSRIDEKFFDKTMLDTSDPTYRLLVKWNEVIEPKILV